MAAIEGVEMKSLSPETKTELKSYFNAINEGGAGRRNP
jgi:hypothetical protein